MEKLQGKHKEFKLITLGANKVFQDSQHNRRKYLIESSDYSSSTVKLQLKLQKFPIKTCLKKPDSIKPLVYSPSFNRFSRFFSYNVDVFLDEEAMFRPYPKEQFHQQSRKNLSFTQKNRYWRTKTLEQYKSSKKWKFKKFRSNCSHQSFSHRPSKIILKSSSASPNKYNSKPNPFQPISQNTTYSSLNHRKHNSKQKPKSLRNPKRGNLK